MPEYNNTHAELLPGRKYARGGPFDGGTGLSCGVQHCPRPVYEDGLCAVHYCYKETIKAKVVYPELEGHRTIPTYFEII